MYIINECVWWGKAGGRTPHCKQAEADKKVIHVWLTELRRYHNLLLVWLQMLLRIQIKAPSPSPTCKAPLLPIPASLFEFYFPSSGTRVLRDSSISGSTQHRIPGIETLTCIKSQA